MSQPEFGDPTRRTYLAAERTFLAWLRSGMAALAVALAVGRLLPSLTEGSPTPFLFLGIGFGVLGVAMVVFGSLRQREVQLSVNSGSFRFLSPGAVLGFTLLGTILGVATVVLVALEL